MSAEQWAKALEGGGERRFTLHFDRLGLEARCRPLTGGEVEECLRMGGERGLRYALYLACGDLREAGESLRRQGKVGSAFDITERLTYGEAAAAGQAILARSGVEGGVTEPRDGEVSAQGEAFVRQMLQGTQGAQPFARMAAAPEDDAGESPRLSLQKGDWTLADRLLAARGNR